MASYYPWFLKNRIFYEKMQTQSVSRVKCEKQKNRIFISVQQIFHHQFLIRVKDFIYGNFQVDESFKLYEIISMKKIA